MIKLNWLVQKITIELWDVCARDLVCALLRILKDRGIWCQSNGERLVFVIDCDECNIEAKRS